MEYRNKVCVYAICKNEEKFIDRWMQSIKDADYVVVLDTGSTDNTCECFKKYPNVIFKQKIFNPWRFDDARNEALSMVPDDTDIFISLDLDEIIVGNGLQLLKERWYNHSQAWYTYVWSHDEHGNPQRIFQQNKIHGKNWEWLYPVHETLNYIGEAPFTILDLTDELRIEHYPDSSKSRSSYLPLLELRAQENPNEIYGLMYLGHEYYYKGFYDNSIRVLTDLLNNHEESLADIEKASVCLFIGDSYIEKGYLGEAIWWNKKAILFDKKYREPYLSIGRIYYKTGLFQDSYDILMEGLKNSERRYSWLERDISWTYEIYDLLSLDLYYLNNKKDSLAFAMKAYQESNYTDERLKDNIRIILSNINDKDFL